MQNARVHTTRTVPWSETKQISTRTSIIPTRKSWWSLRIAGLTTPTASTDIDSTIDRWQGTNTMTNTRGRCVGCRRVSFRTVRLDAATIQVKPSQSQVKSLDLMWPWQRVGPGPHAHCCEVRDGYKASPLHVRPWSRAPQKPQEARMVFFLARLHVRPWSRAHPAKAPAGAGAISHPHSSTSPGVDEA